MRATASTSNSTEIRQYLYTWVDPEKTDPTMLRFTYGGIVTVGTSDVNMRDVSDRWTLDDAFELAAYDKARERFRRKQARMINDFVVDVRTLKASLLS
jgi:hypothetical protein